MFKLRTIALQVALPCAILFLCIVATIGVGTYGLVQVEHRLSQYANETVVKSDAMRNMRFTVLARVDRVRNMALTAEINHMKADQEAIDALVKRYGESLAALKSMPLNDAEQALLASLDQDMVMADKVLKKSQALARTMRPDLAAEVLTGQFAPIQARWFQHLDQLIELGARDREEVMGLARQARTRALNAMLGVGLASALLGVVVAWQVTRGIRLRLARAQEAVERMASGDLAMALQDHGRDELGSMTQAMAGMQDRLRQVVQGIVQSSHAIKVASSEIASGNQDLSSRTELQAANLQQTAATMRQIYDVVQQNGHMAAQANALAAGATRAASSGGEVVSQVVDTMASIQHSSDKIADIIAVIDGIAFQTNILALNAAVEAARAGEQGRGFAVVASEVRALAKRSADAAREIKSLIHASVEEVQSGAQLVGTAGQRMQDILEQVRGLSEWVDKIAAASRTQTDTIGQVNQAVAQIDDMTQRNAALVEEAAAAASSLSQQAESLTRTVAVFKVS